MPAWLNRTLRRRRLFILVGPRLEYVNRGGEWVSFIIHHTSRYWRPGSAALVPLKRSWTLGGNTYVFCRVGRIFRPGLKGLYGAEPLPMRRSHSLSVVSFTRRLPILLEYPLPRSHSILLAAFAFTSRSELAEKDDSAGLLPVI